MDPTLDADSLVAAYATGFFPMPDPDEPTKVLWFHPDPRAILPLDGFHASRSLVRRRKAGGFRVSFDENFSGVMDACADRVDTWINADFHRAYNELFHRGFAHSVEVWNGEKLVGGSYGVHVGGAFFAESMFHRETDMSKIAIWSLVERLRERGFEVLEVQFLTEHLESLGAVEIPRQDYLRRLEPAVSKVCSFP